MNRAQILAEIITNVLTGGRRTTAAGLRQLLSDLVSSIPVITDDTPLLNVVTTTPAVGDVIKWDGTKWVNGAGVDVSGLVHIEGPETINGPKILTADLNLSGVNKRFVSTDAAANSGAGQRLICGPQGISFANVAGTKYISYSIFGITIFDNSTGGAFTFNLQFPSPSANNVLTTRDLGGVLALLSDFNNTNLTGAPTAPTQGAGDNSTKLATTEFVQREKIGNIQILAASAPSPINTDLYRHAEATGISAAYYISAIGSPIHYQKLSVYLHDNTAAKAITWDTAKFKSFGATLPSTTVANKWLIVEFFYDVYTGKWVCMSAINEI